MTSLRIEMFPVKNGDCFLISCFGKQTTNILVDLGYSGTFSNVIRARLKELGSLDLFVITHIDRDHIGGAVSFLKNNGPSSNPKIVPIKEVWHNSYRHLSFKKADTRLDETERRELQEKIAPFAFEEDAEENLGQKDISYKDGSWLGALLQKHGYAWNQTFNGQAVTASLSPIILGDGEVRITVLTPTATQLQNLKKEWKKNLSLYFSHLDLTDDPEFDDAVEYLTQVMKENNTPTNGEDISAHTTLQSIANTSTVPDDGVVNASSISFLLEFAGRKVLFLGDATPVALHEEIRHHFQKIGLPLLVDVIKVAHHGSARNTTQSLLEVMDSDTFLLSANGTHSHPEPEALARIVTRNPRSRPRMLCFNHVTDGSKLLDRDDWRELHSYSVHVPSTGKRLVLTLPSNSEIIEVSEL